MKKKLFNGKASKLFLGLLCLVLAIVIWYFVEYTVIEGLGALSAQG